MKKTEYRLYFYFSIPQSQATSGENRMLVRAESEEERDEIYHAAFSALKNGEKVFELGKFKNRIVINLSLVIAVEKRNVGERRDEDGELV